MFSLLVWQNQMHMDTGSSWILLKCLRKLSGTCYIKKATHTQEKKRILSFSIRAPPLLSEIFNTQILQKDPPWTCFRRISGFRLDTSCCWMYQEIKAMFVPKQNTSDTDLMLLMLLDLSVSLTWTFNSILLDILLFYQHFWTQTWYSLHSCWICRFD